MVLAGETQHRNRPVAGEPPFDFIQGRSLRYAADFPQKIIGERQTIERRPRLEVSLQGLGALGGSGSFSSSCSEGGTTAALTRAGLTRRAGVAI